MSLAEYLAKNYLTKDEPSGGSVTKAQKKGKKRKRKDKDGDSGGGGRGITIADDDALGWEGEEKGDGEGHEDGPLVVRTNTAEFRKSTKQSWIIANPDPNVPPTTTSSSAPGASEAASILASAPRASEEPEDERPTIVMSNGSLPGLQTAAQVTASLAAKRRAELSSLKSSTPTSMGAHADTIYRDASGRIVNIAMARSEARKKAQEAEAAQQAALERNKGDVQLLAAAQRKKDLADAALLPLARFKDDIELNETLKEKDLWNDPAAAFLTKKKKGVSAMGRPLYQGAAPPNRYGIRPGPRWDGVDRGIGFEKKWFEARGRKNARKDLEYAWQIDE